VGAGWNVSVRHRLEALLVRGLVAIVRALPSRAALALGARLGDLARVLGIRREVARANLALAFPDRPAADREQILYAHYRDLGMMLCEAARGGASVYAPEGEVVAAVRGLEHLEAARRSGRGAIVLTGHYGDYGLIAGRLGRLNPMVIFAQGLSNPSVDALMDRTCAEGGVQMLTGRSGLRRMILGLENNGWALMLADQDAGRDGVFVPFMGRPSSTSAFPVELSLRTGAPILMAFITRRADGRNEIDVLPPLTLEPTAPDAVRALTALHVAELERWVRRHPHMWFWLHRRWKTPPPAVGQQGGARSLGSGTRQPGDPMASIVRGA
jgi:KDO2-lipid IV(A) lauroyltransferase